MTREKALERDRIPTGQLLYVDPDDVVSIKDLALNLKLYTEIFKARDQRR